MDTAKLSEQVAIRPIEPGDAREVSLLIEQLGYQRTPEEVLAWIEALPGRGARQAAFVACLGSQIAGWVEVSLEYRLQAAPFALIGGLVVKDDLRGRGIGKKLCAEAEAWSRKQNAEKLRVTSRSTRIDAHRFYLGNGFGATKTSMVFEKKLVD